MKLILAISSLTVQFSERTFPPKNEHKKAVLNPYRLKRNFSYQSTFCLDLHSNCGLLNKKECHDPCFNIKILCVKERERESEQHCGSRKANQIFHQMHK